MIFDKLVYLIKGEVNVLLYIDYQLHKAKSDFEFRIHKNKDWNSKVSQILVLSQLISSSKTGRDLIHFPHNNKSSLFPSYTMIFWITVLHTASQGYR